MKASKRHLIKCNIYSLKLLLKQIEYFLNIIKTSKHQQDIFNGETLRKLLCIFNMVWIYHSMQLKEWDIKRAKLSICEDKIRKFS